MMIRKIVIGILLIINNIILNAQFYNSGQESWKTRWQEVNTQHFRIVFPLNAESLANNYVSALEIMANTILFTHQKLNRKIDVLLHNGTIQSNAWLAWAPARLEVVTTPPQDLYAQQWHNQLAVHELRHAVQIESVNTGLTRWMSHILGQQATGLALGLHIPLWLMEGDAVWSESVFSKAGRLRDPWFLMPLKAQWQSGIDYSYDKAYFGSFQDFVPNHYVLGAALVAHANQRYGNDALHVAFEKAGKHFVWPGAFRQSLKKITGLKPEEFYYSSREGLAPKPLAPKTYPYTHEIYPSLSDETLVYLRQSLGENPCFIKKSGVKTIKLAEAGFYLDTPIDRGPNHILFARRVPHIRWQHRDFTEIVLIYTKSGEQKIYRFSQRPVAPTLSPTGLFIATTETIEDGQQQLLLYDMQKEELIEMTSTPQNTFLTFPSWTNNETLVFIGSGDSGYAIISYNLKYKAWKILTPYTHRPMRSLKAQGDTLFFAGEWDAKGEIMAYLINQNKTYCLTHSLFGADYPFYDKENNKLIYSDYTLNGYKIRIQPSSEMLWKEIPYYFSSGGIPFPRIPTFQTDSSSSVSILGPRPYNGLKHLINIHSYGPVSVSPADGTLKPGFTLMSQNLLNTLTFRGGYEYEFENHGGRLFVESEYAGFFPIISLFAYTGWYTNQNQEGTTLRIQRDEASIQISWPLNLSKGNSFRKISLLTEMVFQDYKQKNTETMSENTFTLPRVDYALYMSISKITPRQNMFPKPGIALRTTLRTTPFKNYHYGQQIAAESWFFLPAWGPHDGLSLYAGLEWNTQYAFASQIIRTPRGVITPIHPFRSSFYSFSINYRTPIYYPDWSLPGLLYLKRIYGGLFYDQFLKVENKTHSLGSELFFDFHIFRLPAPGKFGIRFYYLPNGEKIGMEAFSSISFNF